MKRQTLPLLIAVLVVFSCATPDTEKDKSEIITVLKDETDFFAKKDFEKWAGHWSQTPDVLFTYVVNNEATIAKGWQQLSDLIKNTMQTTVNEKNQAFSREYQTVLVDHDMAWAHFTQTDSLDGTPTVKRETRTLKRENGKWKIIGAHIINMTSFETPPNTTETHLPKEKIKTIMGEPGITIRMQDGWGGMAVLYNDLAVGTDMAPLLKGLKDNSCQVSHWGYLIDGSLRLKYADGKEEFINAGEVFYMRPGHIPVVEKNLKIIDFSPEKGIKELFAHMGKRMEELKNK